MKVMNKYCQGCFCIPLVRRAWRYLLLE